MESNNLVTSIEDSTSVPTSSCMEIVNLPILDADQTVTLSRFLDQSGLSIPAVDASGQPITVSINVVDGLQGTEIINLPVSFPTHSPSSANQTVKPLQNNEGGSSISWSEGSSLLTQRVSNNPHVAAVTSLTSLNTFGEVLEGISPAGHATNVIQVNESPIISDVIEIPPIVNLINPQEKIEKGDKSTQQLNVVIQNSSSSLDHELPVTAGTANVVIGINDSGPHELQEERHTGLMTVDANDVNRVIAGDRVNDEKPLDQIFSKIEAYLTEEVLNFLLGQGFEFLGENQNQLSWNRKAGTDMWTVSGDIAELFKLQQKFSKLMTGRDSDIIHEPPETKVKATQTDSVQQVDFSVMCDILVPAVSAYGRGIKQPARFNQNYTDFHLDIDDSLNTRGEEKSRINRRKRKIPRRSKAYVELGTVIDSTGVPLSENNNTAQEQQVLETDDIISKENLPQSSENSGANTTQWKRTKKDYEALAPFKFFCKLCSFKTKRQSHFLKHSKLHVDSSPLYECQQCNFKTIRSSTLKRHELTHSKVFFPCDKCKYVTDSANLLCKHKKVKHFSNSDASRSQEKPHYQCGVCSYKTTKATSYSRHLQSHGKDFINDPLFQITVAEFQCGECKYKTHRREHYVRHMNNVHSDHRPYLCDLCGRSFKRTDALTQHKLTHIDRQFRKYPFKCSECQKNFRSQAHLTEHMSMHSNARQFLCDICGAAFKTKSCQQKHVKSIHQNPRSYSCDQCKKRFNTKFALQRHKRTHEQPVATIPVEQVSKPDDISHIETQITSHAFQAVLHQTTELSEQDIINTNIEDYAQTNLPDSESAQAIINLPGYF